MYSKISCSISYSGSNTNCSVNRNTSKTKINTIFLNSTSNELLRALGSDSCISIEIRPALYVNTIDDLSRTIKTKISMNSPLDEATNSIWQKTYTGGTFSKKGSVRGSNEEVRDREREE